MRTSSLNQKAPLKLKHIVELNYSIYRIFRKFYLPIKVLFSTYNYFRYEINMLKNVLKSNEPKLIIDVGANIGQFATDFINAGYKGLIWSFEPVEKTHQKILHNSRNFPNWECFNIALSDSMGFSEMHIAANSGLSSSTLPMKTLHHELYPNTNYIAIEKVKTQRLDSFDEIKNYTNVFVKIDVQGSELAVLEGMTGIIDKISVIYVEVSFLSLYENQAEISQVFNFMAKSGFIVQSFVGNSFVNRCLIQSNLIFIRNKLEVTKDKS